MTNPLAGVCQTSPTSSEALKDASIREVGPWLVGKLCHLQMTVTPPAPPSAEVVDDLASPSIPTEAEVSALFSGSDDMNYDEVVPQQGW